MFWASQQDISNILNTKKYNHMIKIPTNEINGSP